MMNEREFREKIDDIYRRVERGLETVDPDLVECEKNQGALTLMFSDRTKCILSTQPSVRQIWVAVASKGIAIHFSYDLNKNHWLDDRSSATELFSFLSDLVQQSSGLSIKF